MKRLNTFIIAASAAAAVLTLATQVEARTGEALAVAEKACLDQGIKPYSTAFEKCVERVAEAYDLTGQVPKLTWPTASIDQDRFHAISQGLPSRV